MVAGAAGRLESPASADEHSRERGRLPGELLDRHADRFPALTRAIADLAFETGGTDALDFGPDRILGGVQALIDRAADRG